MDDRGKHMIISIELDLRFPMFSLGNAVIVTVLIVTELYFAMHMVSRNLWKFEVRFFVFGK